LLTKNGKPIASLDDWKDRAGPKRKIQWRGDCSAMETALAWLDAAPGPPKEIAALLECHSDFGAPISWCAEPEVNIKFDDFAGEPRNTDLLVLADDSHGKYVIALEAKALESFGRRISAERKTASKPALLKRGSNRLKRIDQLVSALFAPKRDEAGVFDALRYQLLTATADALCAAIERGLSRAVLLIQEFVPFDSHNKNTARLETNASDLDAFVQQLTRGAIARISDGHLAGPIRFPESERFRHAPDLYIGKVVANSANTDYGGSPCPRPR
jgi:hypothetical protein